MIGDKIKIGPAGWVYPDWEGIVYPSKKAGNFSGLSFIARYFSVVEINTSFYYPLKRKTTEKWVQQVEQNGKFRFTAKLWQKFTHTEEPLRPLVEHFKEGLKPLLDANKLGALLVQFPWRFKNEAKCRSRLKEILDSFIELPLVVEFRHKSWNKPEILKVLTDYNAAFANIDQPVIGNSIGPTCILTSNIGYIRLHGRNYDGWFEEKSNRDVRYNYLYSRSELDQWISKIRQMEAADTLYIIFNNHFRGKAIANAFQLMTGLLNEPVKIPDTLARAFPELKSVARIEHVGDGSFNLKGVQGELFEDLHEFNKL